jgi:4-phosphopantoate--beta-alanine ligase
MSIPEDHPRYKSLKEREALIAGYKKGITAEAGLIAHGRGEAFDYLLGEKTTVQAKKAIKAAAAGLLLAENPVISVNGNTAVLCPEGLVELSKVTDAKLEINLFYRSEERAKKIEKVLMEKGAKDVLGIEPDAEIEGLSSERRKVSGEGIYKSDVVLVPLEDGDRTEALAGMGKQVIAIDLNPLSRTSQSATITIVDNVTRAMPELIKTVNGLKKLEREELLEIREDFDNAENLKDTTECIRKL